MRKIAEIKTCAVSDCDMVAQKKTYCERHYRRFLKYGSPLGGGVFRVRNGICIVEGCDKKATSRGWCPKHYVRWRHTGTTDDPIKPVRETRYCIVEECGRKHQTKGYCGIHAKRMDRFGDPMICPQGICVVDGCIRAMVHREMCKAHYNQAILDKPEFGTCDVFGCKEPIKSKQYCSSHIMYLHRYGDAAAPKQRVYNGTALDRFEFWVDKSGSMPKKSPELGPCWLWKGHLDKRGYGRIIDDNKWRDMAHRWSYKHFVDEIPDNFVVNHLCENPPCVRPTHLEAISGFDNTIKKGITNAAYLNSKKTHCKNGHELSPENIYTYNNTRICKICLKDRMQRYNYVKINGVRASVSGSNKTGFHGLTVNDNKRGKITYLASTTYRGSQLYIGVFDDPQKAARAYDKKALELYGTKFAYFNFPEELKLSDEERL